MKFMRPADYVIHAFKGVRATARAIGRHPSSVSRWQVPKNRKGTDGMIPHRAQHLVLEAAQNLELDITPTDLIIGRHL